MACTRLLLDAMTAVQMTAVQQFWPATFLPVPAVTAEWQIPVLTLP